MRETKDMLLGERRSEERAEAILAAACRVIARSGARRARLQDIADEAGVSKALIHYYFKTRQELLARAYAFADQRGRARAIEEVRGVESAAVRLRQLLLVYFADEPELLEEWILWSELSSNAVFDPALRPAMEASFATWIVRLEALVMEAIEEGSLSDQVEPRELAHRLTAVVDGFGSQVVRGLLSGEEARALLEAALDRELGTPTPLDGDGRRAVPATGYLRLLARLTEQAVAELEPLAASPDEAEAVRRVSELVSRVGAAPARRRS